MSNIRTDDPSETKPVLYYGLRNPNKNNDLVAVGRNRHEAVFRAQYLKVGAGDNREDQKVTGDQYNEWWDTLSEEDQAHFREFGGSQPPSRTQ
jgi:hypothetical protein